MVKNRKNKGDVVAIVFRLPQPLYEMMMEKKGRDGVPLQQQVLRALKKYFGNK